MSKIDQAFVKAFARRQTADVNQSDTDVEIPAGANKPNAATMTTSARRPSMRVDRSVADTTAVWVDPDQETVHRSNQAHLASPPRPLGLHRGQDTAVETGSPNIDDELLGTDQASEAEESVPSITNAYAIASFTADVGVNSIDLEQSLISNLEHPPQAPPKAQAAPVDATTDTDVIDDSIDTISDGAENASSDRVDAVSDLGSDAAHDAQQATAKSTSTETAPAQSVAPEIKRFRPAWEVDAFDVPEMIANLFFDEDTFEAIGLRMAGVVQSGMQTAAITSVNSGEGRSTTATGIALAAAASGIRVLLIDVDVANPTLADSLRLDVATDWMDQILANESVEEAAIVSANDSLTFLPLTASDSPEEATEPLGELLKIVQPHFDLIVMDAGCGDVALESLPAGLDAAMLVHDAAITSAADVNRFARLLSRHGFHTVGVIENFADSNAETGTRATHDV